MERFIMAACDLHDKTMVLLIAENTDQARKRVFPNDPDGRRMMVDHLRQRAEAGDAEIVFAYEASGQGFGLHDELTDAGIRCYVLAPTRIPRSPKHRSGKNDHRDAKAILGLMRSHLLAGDDEFPDIWIPDHATRDDRELLRGRLDAAEKAAKVKTQIQSLLKRHDLRRPPHSGTGWSQAFRSWLGWLARYEASAHNPLGPQTRVALRSLLRQMNFLEQEVKELDQAMAHLMEAPRYAKPARALVERKGVGPLTAMVFLTEIGDLNRFSNRRQLAGYLGLVPRSDESGEASDRKGHITRQGPSRVRKVLCQAVWSAIRGDSELGAAYRRVARKNPKRTKIAVVAAMRRLSTLMWHRARATTEPPVDRRTA